MDYKKKSGGPGEDVYTADALDECENQDYLSFSGSKHTLLYDTEFKNSKKESDLQRNRKRQGRGRIPNIAVILMIFIVLLAIIAAVVLALYFCTKDTPKTTSAIKIVEVTKIQAFQGNVLLQTPWNVELKDSNSNTYKQETQSFETAMDIVYKNSALSNRYNETKVTRFSEGSINVEFIIKLSYRVEQTIDTSDTSNSDEGDTPDGTILHEKPKDPVINPMLIKEIAEENLPAFVNTSVEVSELSEIQEESIQTSMKTFRRTTDATLQSPAKNSKPESPITIEGKSSAPKETITKEQLPSESTEKSVKTAPNPTYIFYPKTSRPKAASNRHASTKQLSTSSSKYLLTSTPSKTTMQVKSAPTPSRPTIPRWNPCNSSELAYYWVKMTFQELVWNETLLDSRSYEFQSTAMLLTIAMMTTISESKYNQQICSFTIQGFSIEFQDTDPVKDASTPPVVAHGLVQGLSNSSLNEEELLHIIASVQIEKFGHDPSRGRVKRYATLDELINTTATTHPYITTTIPKTITEEMSTVATPTKWPWQTISEKATPTAAVNNTISDITRTATATTHFVQSCSTTDLEVRLSEGSYGRLEMKRKNCPSDTWGTVCDDMWDILDATVVCRQLGFPDSTPVFAYRGAFFGEGSGYIWGNRFDCRGTETQMSQCSFQGWGNIHCSHIQDAGASCGQEFTTHTTATTLPPSKTTIKYIPTTPPYYSSQIRLVNGSNCLDGRVEVYYNGAWGTVCDDSWDSYDAVVVCRMLGYSTVGAMAVCCAGFGSNYNLGIFLDDVSCTGYESSIYSCNHRGWFSHDCTHYEDAGVRCGGTTNQCVSANPSVNCTFDTSTCSYTTFALSGAAVWSFSYGYSHFSNPLSGVAYYTNRDGFETDMAYLKSPEFAVNKTNSYSIEFYYWINASGENVLSASISMDDVSHSVWEIPSLHREEEETWMYQCVNLGELDAASSLSVYFLATRGSHRTRTIAIDNVAFGSRTCTYGLQAGICDFEQPSVAAYSINCTNCKTNAPLYRWHWAKGETPSNATGPNVDKTFGNNTGRYMYAEATYGLEGDATALIFPGVSTSKTYQSIQFFYHMYGSDIGTLRVALESNGRESIIWQKSGEQGDFWARDCVVLPADATVKIKFVAVKGAGPLGDIAVDDISLLTTSCPHAISCFKSFKECGYSRTSTSSNFTWGWNGEIAAPSPLRECNFESGTCNFTSDYWQIVNAPWTSYWGVTFIDPTYSESGQFMLIQGNYYYMGGYLYSAPFLVETNDCELSFLYSYYTFSDVYVQVYQHNNNGSSVYLSRDYYSYYNSSNMWSRKTVMLTQMTEMAFISIYVSGYQFAFAVDEIQFTNCDASLGTAEGEIAELLSPTFSHLGGKHFLTFYHTITSNDVIEVQLRGRSGNSTQREESIVTLNSFVDEDELVCINLPDVVSTMKVVFQARKGDNEIKQMATSASIRNVDLLEGQCPDTLDVHNCTFEADHVLCGRVVSTPGTSTCDKMVYRWMRHSGPTLTDGTGPSHDHTTETSGTGFANSGLKAAGYYMYADASFGNPGDTTTLQLKEFTVGNFCSMEFFYHIKGSSDPNLTVIEKIRRQANLFRSRNVDVWIPGCIMLKNNCNLENNNTRIIQFQAQRGATPYGDIAIDDISLSHERCPENSIACDFENSMCGYVAETGWVWIRSSNGSYLKTEELSSKLVFPPIEGPSCISIFYSAIDVRQILYPSNLNLFIGEYVYPLQIDGILRMVNVPITSEMSYMEMYIASEMYISSVFMLHNITFSTTCPSLECQAGDFSCLNYCIYDNQVCDGQINNCMNGEDENELTCPTQVSCDFNRKYMCGYSFFMVFPVVENGTAEDCFFLSGQLSNKASMLCDDIEKIDSTSTTNVVTTMAREQGVNGPLVAGTLCTVQYVNRKHYLEITMLTLYTMGNVEPGNKIQYTFKFIYNTEDTPNTYINFITSNQLAYAESPIRIYSRNSCLRYKYYQEGVGWHRIAANSSSLLSDIVLFSDYLRAKRWTKVQVNLPTGQYSIVFEFNTNSYSSEARIDDVDVLDGPCENISISCNNETEFECSISLWNEDILGICLSLDLRCDRKIDCLGGTDELECPLNVTCNFEHGLCGYYNKSEGYGNVWRREKAPYAMGYINLYDQKLGSTGSFMVVGSIDSYSSISDELLSPNFTSYNYMCRLNYSIAFYVDSYMYMFVNLYNNDGYVEQVDNIYSSYKTEATWQDRSVWIPMGQFYIGFYAYGWRFSLALDDVHISNCASKSSCDGDTEFQCQISTDNGVVSVCLHKTSICDQYIDCLDGVDEENCSSNVTCDFDDGLCGYYNKIKSYRNAWRKEQAPYLLGNTSIYDQKLGSTGSFMVAGKVDSYSSYQGIELLSPNFTSYNYMCRLNYSIAFYVQSYIRIAVILYNKEGYVNQLDYISDSYEPQPTWQERSVQIPMGQYYIGFNAYGTNFQLALDAVHISKCDPPSSCHVDTEFRCYIENEDSVVSICLHKTSLCDRYIDCMNGTDEENCSFNATCNFEEGFCGYYSKDKYVNNAWRLEEAPYMMGYNMIYDQTFGSDGSFLVVGNKNPDIWLNSELISANFSSLNYNCRLNYSVNFNVNYFIAMYVTLYDENGYVKQLDYMYNYSVSVASWNERSLEIPVGHFYVGFYIYGEGFELALDNIYLSNCTAKATCSNATEFGCQVSTETGDVRVCLLRQSLCDYNTDCKDGVDEQYCNFSVSCQFEETNSCGYHNSSGSPYEAWTRVAAPYYLYSTYMYDTVYGSSGHFMYIGSNSYAYGKLSAPYFTVTSSDCHLHYTTALYVHDYVSVSVNLNNRNGYVSQIDYVYSSYNVSPLWNYRSVYIQYMGQFYLTFDISGSYFHFLLDNVYLSNCNGTMNGSTTVLSPINTSTPSSVEENSTYTAFTNEPIASTTTASSGDCILNPVQKCAERGFEYVTRTNIRGITNVTDAFNILKYYEIYADHLTEMPCTEPGITLYCGWYTTACENGESRPLCREACESISLGCGDWTQYLGLYDSTKVLGYYCKFLPYLSEEPNCLNVDVSAIATPRNNVTSETQNKTEYKKTIEDIRLFGGNEEYNGRVELKVNGIWGTLCGYINYEAAALLCEFLGFSSPAQPVYGSMYGNGPGHVVSDIYCGMNEKDINNCTIEYYNTCPWYYENMGLECTGSSVSCAFEVSTCGYIGDYWMLDKYSGGMTLSRTAKEGKTAFLRSPKFTLPYDGSISFKYRIHRAARETFGLNIKYDGGEEALFSIKSDYDGNFSECVELPGHEGRKLQLVFYLNRGQPLDGTNMDSKLLEVFVQPTACEKDTCTFESLSSCHFSDGCSDQNAYKFQLTTGPVFSPFTGPDADHTYKNHTGHYMLADASYGTVGDSASFNIYKYFEETGNLFLRFFYYMNGPNVKSLEVSLKTEQSNEKTIYETISSNHGPSWYMACTVLNISKSGKYIMVFKATRGNGTQGDIAIDDITVTTTPCPHPVSCAFEEPNKCGYVIESSSYYWQSTSSYLLNVLGHLDGYHMQAVSDTSVEGDRAVIKSPAFDLTRSTKCVFFKFYMFGNNVGSLSVTVSYDNGKKKERGFYTSGSQGNEWFLANIPLNYTGYDNVSIIFSAIQGQDGDSIVALDDIVISEKACTYGIQHETCDFDSPFTGAYQSDCSYDSQYQWIRHVGPSLTSGTGPQFDANGDPAGAYLIADSSFGAENHHSTVSFPPIVTSSTTKLTFYHHMYGRDDQIADLSVMFATESGLMVLENLCCNNEDIWKFKCIALPSTLHGVLHFKAQRKKGVFGDVALDKIHLLDGDCPGMSVACDFDHTDFICGYQGNWKRKSVGSNYFLRSEGNDKLLSPSSTLNGSACISFNYQLLANDIKSGLILILHYELTSASQFGRKVLFNVTGHQGPLWKKGQIQVDEEEALSFYIQFVSSGAGIYSLDNITVHTGLCSPLDCTVDQFTCLEKCIPSANECDKKAECALGEDEERTCHPDITCNFEANYHCGYSNVSSSDQWHWVDSGSSNLDEDGIFGHFLLANPSYHIRTSVQSPVVKIKENKCLRFDYYSTGVFYVTLDQRTQTDWVDNIMHQYWRAGQVDVYPGDVRVYFLARRSSPYDQGSVVAIDNIKLMNGTCMEHKLECPDTMVSCDDNNKCVDKEKLCDLVWDCFDGSDEGRKYCNVSIRCNFETKSRCGYTNLSSGNTPWNHTRGSLFQIPQFDKTYGTHEGHFMVVTNRQDPMGYGSSFLMLNNNASLISPTEEIQSESCVEFYYYLNGSAVRPNPLSAQLLVYVISGNQKTLLWYDHVNRTINGWIKGWVPVPKGTVGVVFEAKTATTSAIWPGVVALDEVSLKNETCSQPLHCGLDTFRCTISRVCIPVYLQCDGGNDCSDGSDEDSCNNKPDYEVRLVDGDLSYGSIAIFFQGRWIPVCHGYDGNLVASLTCKQLGYIGRYQSGVAYSWQKPVTQTISVTCQYYHTNLSQCFMSDTTHTLCSSYQAVLCSNTECFSGERICPRSTKCVPVQYFCDGITDCPSAEDENNCANCNSSEFECANHQCIPVSQRCDGIAQCKDASDEYRCVIIDDRNGSISIFHSGSKYLPVCSSNMTTALVNILCKLSGQGSALLYNSAPQAVNGLTLSADSTVSGTLLPGYRTSVDTCYPMEIQCQFIGCGTSSLTDEVILPKILFGREVTLGQFPWQIALFLGSWFQCGGSIIHPNWVLTAAHCIQDDTFEYSIRLGTISLNDTSQGLTKLVSRIYSHTEFSYYDLSYDIGLLYFSTPIVMNDYVRPVCLSSQLFYQDLLNQGPNAECYISGWGKTEEFVLGDGSTDMLQMTKVNLIDSDECKHLVDFSMQDTVVCVNNENLGQPACYGDSGGPLVCRNKYGRLQLLAITSFGSAGTCTRDGPNGYQLVHPYLNWIKTITGLNFTNVDF